MFSHAHSCLIASHSALAVCTCARGMPVLSDITFLKYDCASVWLQN